jgi:hypothetical protein
LASAKIIRLEIECSRNWPADFHRHFEAIVTRRQVQNSSVAIDGNRSPSSTSRRGQGRRMEVDVEPAAEFERRLAPFSLGVDEHDHVAAHRAGFVTGLELVFHRDVYDPLRRLGGGIYGVR